MPIEQIVYGDKVLAVNQHGDLEEQTVMFVSLHEKEEYEMTNILLQSGKTISTTSNHMMVVYPNGKSTLKRASNVECGDTFFSYGANGAMTEDRVVSVDTHVQDTAVANLIIAGHVLADDVVASVRVEGDMPESLWKAGV